MHTVEPFVPEPVSFEAEIAIEKLKRCKAPGTDQILREMFQIGRNMLHSEIHICINSVWNKKKLSGQ
jgi:hypothetical protein